ncbi:MAG: hypothetical protein HY276_03530 [Ignavibacteriales bacterium]|nr:hypothetical protein [Ignavibacteriales bacterium]
MKKVFQSVMVLSFIFSTVLIAGDIKGKVKAVGVKNSANAVIYIEKIAGKKFDPPKEAVTMDQKNLVFKRGRTHSKIRVVSRLFFAMSIPRWRLIFWFLKRRITP